MRSFLFLVFLLSLTQISISQSVELQVIGSSGVEIENSNGELYFTLGEPASELLEAENYQLTQGYHQGLILFVKVEEVTQNPFEVSLFPNPTRDFVNIKLKDISFENFEYTLHDLTGKVLMVGAFQENIERLDLSKLASSSYFLKIYNTPAGYQVTYKLQKSH